MHAHAGSRLPPHLIIRKLMATPERLFMPKNKKKVLNVIVFINLKHGVFVKLLTGSDTGGSAHLNSLLPHDKYVNKKGKAAARMTTQEYEDCVKAAVAHYTPAAQAGACFARRVGRFVLVHDRSTCHTREGTIKLGARRSEAMLTAMLAPPRSPDLMPLDYTVFGTVKSKLLRELQHLDTWKEKASRFVELLQGFDCNSAIKSFPRRLQQILLVKGEHIRK